MNYKKSIIGSSIAFIIATSCCWLSAILIAIGGGSAVMRIANGLEKAGKTSVKAYACHPGSSRTSLISTSGSLMMRAIFGLMKLTPLTQSAEKGAYPQLMCATEAELDQKAFYGPTGRSYWVGPVGSHKIEAHVKDNKISKKLWDMSEELTGIKWQI